MGQYDALIATAKRLIAQKGQAVTWKSIGDPVADPNKPWEPTSQVVTDYSANIAFLPINLSTRKFSQAITGTDIPIGTEKGYMGAQSFEPKIKDVILRNGKTLTVLSIDRIAPDGSPILYTLELGE